MKYAGISTTWWLAAILAVAAVVRLYDFTGTGLWQDERIALLAAHGHRLTAPDVPEAETFSSQWYSDWNTLRNTRDAMLVEEGGNTIMYQLVLRGWIALFGPGDLSLRTLGLLIGLGTVLALFFFMRRLTGAVRWGLLAATLAAFHPLMVQYSLEVRSYGFVGLLCLVGSYLFVRLFVVPDEDRSPREFYLLLGLYGIVAASSMLAHYFAFFIYAPHGLWMLVFNRRVRDWLGYAGAVAVVGAAMAVWMYPARGIDGFPHMATRNQKWLNLVESVEDKADEIGLRKATPLYVAGGLSQSLTSLGGTALQVRGHRIRHFFPLLVLPLLLALAGIFRSGLPPRIRWLLLFLIGTLPLACVAMAFQSGHTIAFNPSYNIVNVTFFTSAMALGVAAAWRTRRRALRRTLLAAFVLHAAVMFYSAQPRDHHFMQGKNPYEVTAKAIASEWREGEKVVWPDGYVAQVCNIYLLDRPEIPQSIGGHGTKAVFLENAAGERREAGRITDAWHRLED